MPATHYHYAIEEIEGRYLSDLLEVLEVEVDKPQDLISHSKGKGNNNDYDLETDSVILDLGNNEWFISISDKKETGLKLYLKSGIATPEELAEYKELYSKWLILASEDRYKGVEIDYTHDALVALMKKFMPKEVWTVRIEGDVLDRDVIQDIDVLALVSPGNRSTHVDLDLDDVYKDLCDKKLGYKYLLDGFQGVNPEKNISVLIVLAHDEGGNLKGMRVTHVDFSRNSYLARGQYACAKGTGTIIQRFTETILRKLRYRFHENLGAVVVSHEPTTTRSRRVQEWKKLKNGQLRMRFRAIPTAVSFWTHVGYKTIKVITEDGEEYHIMEKVLDMPTEGSVVVGPGPAPKRKTARPRATALQSSSSSSSSSSLGEATSRPPPAQKQRTKKGGKALS